MKKIWRNFIDIINVTIRYLTIQRIYIAARACKLRFPYGNKSKSSWSHSSSVCVYSKEKIGSQPQKIR